MQARHVWLALTFVVAAIGARPAFAQQTLVLTNGDQLSGELIRIDEGMWVFRHVGNDVELPADSVAAFTAPEPIGIRLADSTRLAASVSPTAAGLLLRGSDGASRTVAPTALAAVGDPNDLDLLRPLEIGLFSPFLRFWRGTASLGATLKDGNSNSKNLHFFGELVRQTPRDRLTFIVNLSVENDRLSTGGLETTDESYIGSIRADIFVEEKVFLFGSTRHQRDRFKDLNWRSYNVVGAGYQFVANDKTDLRAGAALGLRFEDFTTGGSQFNEIGSLNGSWRQELGPFELGVRGDYTPALDNLSDYEVLTLSNLTVSLIGGLGFRIALIYEYDNTPLAGRERNDTEFTWTVAYAFGG